MSTMTATAPAFTVDAKPLAEAVSWIARHLPAKPVIPILAGMLVDTDGEQVTLSAFDYDTAAATRIDAEIHGTGRALIPGRFLAELVKTFPDRPVAVTVHESTATVGCGSITLTVPLMTIEDYPALPAVSPTVGTVDADALADLVTRVGLAADTTGSSSIQCMRGIHLSVTADQIEALGTDRYRAARGHAEWVGKLDGEVTALVPAVALLDAAKALDGQVTVGLDDNLLSLATTTRTVTTRLMAEPFPVQMRTAFTGRGEKPAIVWTAELTAALKRADLVRADKKASVVLNITGDGLTVSARSTEIAAATGEVIECTYFGEPMTLHVNPLYLADALAGLAAKRAELSFTHPHKPINVTSPDDPDLTYQHAVVPIRSLS